jgi:hypothetical protein
VRYALLVMLMAVFWSAGCSSPETMRSRGGGPGADIGNRDKIVRMHEGSKPFDRTPKLIPAKSPPLESARQADQLSRK